MEFSSRGRGGGGFSRGRGQQGSFRGNNQNYRNESSRGRGQNFGGKFDSDTNERKSL